MYCYCGNIIKNILESLSPNACKDGVVQDLMSIGGIISSYAQATEIRQSGKFSSSRLPLLADNRGTVTSSSSCCSLADETPSR